MRLYVTTVNRKAPIERGGDALIVDFDSKRIVKRVPIVPRDPAVLDPNPRGNSRGGRGIQELGDEWVIADYHSLLVCDADLTVKRRVSHPLFASLHEIARAGERSFLVSSTAVDAAIEIDIDTGKTLREFHPREHPELQREFGLTPLAIDKHADNRLRFLGNEHFQHPHHLHLNAVAFHRDAPLALFSKQGVIVDLERGATLVRDPALKGAHNLLVRDDGIAYANHTVGRGVLVFDLGTGKRVRHLGYGNEPFIAGLLRFREPIYHLRRKLEKIGLLPVRASRPLFARGLARHAGRIYVGIAPATILALEESSGKLVDWFTISNDVDACVHGLEVDVDKS